MPESVTAVNFAKSLICPLPKTMQCRSDLSMCIPLPADLTDRPSTANDRTLTGAI